MTTPLWLDGDLEGAHQARLAAWREQHPESPHPFHDLATLEALKAENDRLAEQDLRERPDVCASYPTLMTIGNTHKCNLTCNMCFKQLDEVDNMSLPDMGWSRFASLGHELFPHLRRVALTVSGEPLISRTIFDELDLMASYGVRGSITTNGMPLARRGLMEHLLPALHALVVSMDGASQPVFDSIRRGASFPKVLEHVRRFNAARDALPRNAYRPRLEFNHILQWKNVTELPRLIELAHELQVDHVEVDRVYVHTGLNEADSLDRFRELTNRMLDEARASAKRLGVSLRLPDRFTLPADYAELPYQAPEEAALLAHAHEELRTVPFDAQKHERFDLDPVYAELKRVEAARGDNEAYVDHLFDKGLLIGSLQWGVPRLGPSLMPRGYEKVSSCLYPWRESFVEFNGVVAPCCNHSMSAGRVMGQYEVGDSFRALWNGPVYQELRRSLSSGRSFKFCRYCYVVEGANEAQWGGEQTWCRMHVALEGDAPAVAGQVPAGRRLMLTEVRSGPAFEGARLEIAAESDVLTTLVAERASSGEWTCERRFDRGPTQLPTVAAEKVVYLRCLGSRKLDVELVGYLV